jgi:hypothetical protein
MIGSSHAQLMQRDAARAEFAWRAQGLAIGVLVDLRPAQALALARRFPELRTPAEREAWYREAYPEFEGPDDAGFI